jgi:hypothetical protein
MTRTADPAAGRHTEGAALPPQDPVLLYFRWRDRDFKCFRQAMTLERMRI